MDDTSVHFFLQMALLSPMEVEQLRKAERRKLASEGSGVLRVVDRGVPEYAFPVLFVLVSEEKEKEEKEEAPEDFFALLSR